MQPITNNLKAKVALAIGAILVAMLGAGAWVNISIFAAEYLQWQEARSTLLVQPLIVRVKDLLSQVGYNPNGLIVLKGDVLALLKDHPELAQIAIYDRDGNLALHSDANEEKKLAIHGAIETSLARQPKTNLTLALADNYHFLQPGVHEKGTLCIAQATRWQPRQGEHPLTPARRNRAGLVRKSNHDLAALASDRSSRPSDWKSELSADGGATRRPQAGSES